MTPFKRELERQLLQAARRRRGRFALTPRALARPAMATALAAAAVLAVVAGLASIERDPERAVTPPSPVTHHGRYVAGAGSDQIRLLLVPSGYELRGPRLYLYGTLIERSGTLGFVRPPGDGRLPPGLTRAQRDNCLLPRADGTYRWARSGNRLTLAVVDDPCGPRRAVLDGRSFLRVGD